MQGTLISYGPSSSHLAFISATRHPLKPQRHVLLVAGLTEGLLGCNYAPQLAQQLDRVGWSLVQVQLTSSYTGYGISSLDRDAEELQLLTSFLKWTQGSTGAVLVGYSTGAQGTVRLMQRRARAAAAAEAASAEGGAAVGVTADDELPILGTVLQAAVSDREYLVNMEEMPGMAAKAKEMVAAGRGEEICGRWHGFDGAPMTARRMCALYDWLGDDDMFSSDLTDAKLRSILAPVGAAPCLILQSGADEYVRAGVDVSELAGRFAAAVGPAARSVVLPGAGHALRGFEDKAAQLIADFVQTLGGAASC